MVSVSLDIDPAVEATAKGQLFDCGAVLKVNVDTATTGARYGRHGHGAEEFLPRREDEIATVSGVYVQNQNLVAPDCDVGVGPLVVPPFRDLAGVERGRMHATFDHGALVYDGENGVSCLR